MIGFSFTEDNETLTLFNFLQKFAKNGLHSPHTDGWGCYLKDSENRIFCFKNTTPIYKDKMENFNSMMGIFHARKASPGLSHGTLQLHPFIADDSIFAHNGTIEDASLNNPFSSDSFELFDYLKDFSDFEDFIKKIISFKNECSFTSINFLMINDNSFYVLNLYNEEKDYYTLWIKKDEKGIVVSSEPIDSSSKPLRNGDLLKIVSGKLVEEVNLLGGIK
jgi:glutamine amidotransferase